MTKAILEPELKKVLKKLAPAIDKERFVREAIEEKILALKRAKILKLSKKIKLGLKKRGYSTGEVLKDFEKTT